jgi:uncharacterized protein YjaG (DUF416 family)
MASLLHFDEPNLIVRLAKLPNELRVAFAALCAERQLPNYARFSARSGLGDPSVLKEALVSIWEDVQGRPVSNARLEAILERCMALIPNGDEDTEEETAYADDAAAAVAYTIRARLAGDPQEAAWAARRAYEAVDHFIVSQLNSTIVERDQEGNIASHPLAQAELMRQQDDLKDLLSVSAEKPVPTSLISDLRDRARRDAELFLKAATRH